MQNTKNIFIEKKEKFLEQLQGKTLKYKRYSKAPIRYGGGKSLAVGIIVEYFPNDLKRLISPFIGGGSVEVASAIELGIEVRASDIFDILVNFWQTLINNNDELYNSLILLKPTKQNYEYIKTELTKHYKKEIKLDPLTLAKYYYFNFNLSYGPGFLGWMSKIYEDDIKYMKLLEKLKELKNINMKVECQSFEEAFKIYENDFFYCDPPYFLDGDSKMFKGIYPMRNFPIHHNGFDHEKLATLLKQHKGKFILSYNDCEFVRETYKNFKIIDVSWQYTMGQGETRIGKNRILSNNMTNIKQSHELLIIKE